MDGVERHVEVKGSAIAGVETVQLTQGEVEHARGWQPTDLVIVDGISVSRKTDGSIRTAGGQLRIWKDWLPADSDLRPTHLRYSVN